jgi:hypothetical protein
VSTPSAGETHEEAFERIEASVDRGDADLRELGFWRLLSTVKAEPALAERWAEVAGRIDRKAFEARVRVRVPVWVGNLVLGGGVAVSSSLAALALFLVGSSGGREARPVLAGLALLAAAGGLSLTVHSPTHWLVGRLVGIRFTHYFVSWRPFPPRPGLKAEYASYLRSAPRRRALMHASGAIATKLAPFGVLAALGPFDGYRRLPDWSLWAVTLLGVLQIVSDLAFSIRSSDWKKVRRELRVARNVSRR